MRNIIFGEDIKSYKLITQSVQDWRSVVHIRKTKKDPKF
jgi:hypothetical protein